MLECGLALGLTHTNKGHCSSLSPLIIYMHMNKRPCVNAGRLVSFPAHSDVKKKTDKGSVQLKPFFMCVLSYFRSYLT